MSKFADRNATHEVETEKLLFSIIVVAYNVQNFIEQALVSCVNADRLDYEVIVVENNSDDRTLELIRRVQSEYEGIFKIVVNPENYGLGIARNIGLAASIGEYVLFLDGDDWFRSSVLDTLSQTIATHPSDLVVFNHARVHDNGDVIPNKKSHLLDAGWRNSTREKVSLLQNFNVAWNKAYKREFLMRHGVAFRPGYYEDIDWSFQAQLLAETVYVIPDILINYRQRSGSITKSQDVRHFDILDQYAYVLNSISQNASYRVNFAEVIYRYSFGQCLNVLNSGRLPKSAEKSFLMAFAKLAKKFRDLGDIRLLTREERIVATEQLWLYRASRFSSFLYRSAQRLLCSELSLRAIYKALKNSALRTEARVHSLLLPIKPKTVLLEAYWGRKIDCNPFAIALALEKQGYDCIWSTTARTAIPVGYKPKSVKRHSRQYRRLLSTAKFLVSNANFPDYWTKRAGQIHLQTFHGTPLKYMGLDIIKTDPGELDWQGYVVRSKRWDFALSSNDYSSRIWRKNSPYNYSILETGYPRNDMLFNASSEDLERIRGQIGIPSGKKVALYAPTFRPKEKGMKFDCSQHFDPEAVQRALGDEWVLLLRGHYFLRAGKTISNEAIIDVSNYVVTNEVCLISDILITDYSSIMFDYACLNRPIILYCYDVEYYRKKRGLYFDILQEGPSKALTTHAELLRVLSDGKAFEQCNTDQYLSFIKKFSSYDDGSSCAKIIDNVFK